jgi:hypothetical protein
MVFSVSPSISIREVDATAVIPAISTPPAGFAGVFRWGPVNERILVSSERELADRFGTPTDFNAETFFTAADFLAYSNALYVVRADNGTETATSTNFEARHPGAIGNSLEISYVTNAGFQIEIADVDVIDGSIAFNSNSLIIETDFDINTSFVENDILQIGNDNIGYQDLVISAYIVSEDTDANTAITIFTHSFTFKNNYTLAETDLIDLKLTKKWGFANVTGIAPDADNIHIVVTDKGGAATGSAGSILEVYRNVSTDATAKLSDGTTNYYRNVLENRSNWIYATSASITGNSSYQILEGGSDGVDETGNTFASVSNAYNLFADANEVDIAFILQGKAVDNRVATHISQNIAETRKDCVAFISPTRAAVVDPVNPIQKLNNVIAYRNSIQSSSYWFMDSGYKYRYDKYNDVYRWVPLNGDMAGLAARVEPWESPAGFKRGIIKNVVKLAFNPNKTQRDQLYGRDINPVISQVGQGVLLFGDKTGLGRPSAFDRINVRRLFITVEKAIASVSASFLFDFNDEFTQTQFKNIVEPFLRDIQGKRGIIDFRVVSDSTVNTPDVIDRNIFRGNIFIKPARSISFIELTFVATRTGVEFDEIVGQAI